ncbi:MULTISPECIES: hypothetical protein [Amycolatopsis]|uniref:Uncharacterized protein n=1 Tax=Amycolatopsis silviterrae TaxID=1656914 RepID=A0ABW5HM01_9PSEU
MTHRGWRVSAKLGKGVSAMKKYTKPQAKKVNAGAVLRSNV